MALARAIILEFEYRRAPGHISVSDSRTPQPGGPGVSTCIPQEQDVPLKPPGAGFPLCHILRLLRITALAPTGTITAFATDNVENIILCRSATGAQQLLLMGR
jgi:hypothetical protein